MTDQDETKHALMSRVARITRAYVTNNPLQAGELPALIASIHSSLETLSSTETPLEAPTPHVPVKKSVTNDYIVCLEDGLRFKSLKRHLQASHGMTPEEYREKWGLPPDYPMTASSYSQSRSRIAKDMSFGRKPGTKVKPRAKPATEPRRTDPLQRVLPPHQRRARSPGPPPTNRVTSPSPRSDAGPTFLP